MLTTTTTTTRPNIYPQPPQTHEQNKRVLWPARFRAQQRKEPDHQRRCQAAWYTRTHTPVAAIAKRIHNFDSISSTLDRSLAKELPSNIADGGTIREGFDEALDHTRSLTRDSQKWLAEFEQGEQDRTGIKNLKIRYNGAFGYFIEVTKSNIALVPEEYVRKQTMKNAERYTTDLLKEREREILHAEEKALAREEVIFNDLI